ncbi:MAG TPA: isocitrate/isopropylmalate family dehydrogenase, partial [Dehalococcoidia bacterium]|nr:isocitrate/isopropylmalate family dehydrogenase [Dehalococcoidia bacterium]
MAHDVTLIRGDGTGPEIVEAAVRVLEASGVQFNWDDKDAGEMAVPKHGTPLPDETIESCKRTKCVYKGPLTTPVGGGFRSINVGLRMALDLYANVRPAKTYQGVRSRYENIDLIGIRENTEDLYAGVEFEQGSEEALQIIDIAGRLAKKEIRKDSGIGIKPISIFGTRRIVKFAFDYAKA